MPVSGFFLDDFFLLNMLKVLIINKYFRNWFQIFMCFVEGFHDRQVGIFESIENRSNPGSQNQFCLPFWRMTAGFVGIEEIVVWFF